MRKKLLTLDDLVMFCQEQKLYHFSSKEDGEQLFVQVPAEFKKDNEDDGRLLMATVKCFHTGINLNRSSLTEDAAKKAMKNMAYKPILANFTEDDEGNPDFTSHDYEIDDDGNIVYIEHQVGCFTTDVPYMEEDPDNEGRKYIYARCAIPREYTKAAEIIERKGGTKVSVELAVNEMSYSAKEKCLILEDVDVSGLTLLGIDPDTKEEIHEGMAGSRLDIADFNKENNSVRFENDEKTIEIMQELKETLDNYIAVHAAQNFKKGGNDVEDNKEVEVTETPEEITEVEMAAEEEVVEEAKTEESTEEVADAEAEDEAAEETPSEDFDDNNESLNDEEEFPSSDQKYEINYTVTYGDQKKDFAISLQDKISALYTLVNDTYSEQDGCWYDVTVFEDPKYVIMSDWWSGKGYKQNYKVKNDVYSLTGDRCVVKQIWVTEDEEKQLDQMKSNYSEISDKLAKYESEPEKMEILNSADYSSISESEEFVAFKSQDAHFDLSVDEVRAKADEMLLNAAKAGKVDFAKADDKKKEIGMKKLPINTPHKRSRYGGLGKTKSE